MRRPEGRWNGVGLTRLHERCADHPGERCERDDRAEDQRHVQQNDREWPLHVRSPRRNPSWSNAPASVIRSRSAAMVAAIPIRHQRKPASYMRRTRLVVLRKGPPWVITYGSANSWK